MLATCLDDFDIIGIGGAVQDAGGDDCHGMHHFFKLCEIANCACDWIYGTEFPDIN
jgi:hypothetical protein